MNGEEALVVASWGASQPDAPVAWLTRGEEAPGR
jgi:hypothetical protein